MTWQSTLSWQNAQKRAVILQKIRQFFDNRNVIEVDTPALSQGTITDIHLEALSCRYNFLSDSVASKSTSFYLQTSPEFHMKRLLASGYGCIFQIAKAFRHEEFGSYHNPEFSLLEWYRINFDHFDLMTEVGELLKALLNCAEPTINTYQEIYIDHVNCDPLTATSDELLTLISQRNMLSDWLLRTRDNDILLQFIFSEIIEPEIGKLAPCFVYNFPKSQASLAKICPIDSRVAQRFECYYKGIELANGFNELTSYQDQLIRFQEDNEKRKLLRLKQKPIDSHFLSALSNGLPQCSGVALGVDRLVMLALNAEHIEQVISFPIERA